MVPVGRSWEDLGGMRSLDFRILILRFLGRNCEVFRNQNCRISESQALTFCREDVFAIGRVWNTKSPGFYSLRIFRIFRH